MVVRFCIYFSGEFTGFIDILDVGCGRGVKDESRGSAQAPVRILPSSRLRPPVRKDRLTREKQVY